MPSCSTTKRHLLKYFGPRLKKQQHELALQLQNVDILFLRTEQKVDPEMAVSVDKDTGEDSSWK